MSRCCSVWWTVNTRPAILLNFAVTRWCIFCVFVLPLLCFLLCGVLISSHTPHLFCGFSSSWFVKRVSVVWNFSRVFCEKRAVLGFSFFSFPGFSPLSGLWSFLCSWHVPTVCACVRVCCVNVYLFVTFSLVSALKSLLFELGVFVCVCRFADLRVCLFMLAFEVMFFHRGCTSFDTLVAVSLPRVFNWLWIIRFARRTNIFHHESPNKTI